MRFVTLRPYRIRVRQNPTTPMAQRTRAITRHQFGLIPFRSPLLRELRLLSFPRGTISGVASPEDAGPEDLIYLDAPKHLARAQASAAKCVLVREGVALDRKTLLIVKEPKLAFAKAAAWLLEIPPIANGIHPTAL